MANSANLNPLPIADRSSEIQALSIRAFEAALPPNKFTFRRETIEDAGIDGSLELKIDGTYTNLRAQTQLKGTDSEETNRDGSISIEVNVSNLNYLLNGQSPIYILYVVPTNQLYYAWAREERIRLDQSNPSWLQQKTVRIRFKNILTPAAVEQIHKRIKDEAIMQKKVNDILTSASNTENVVFSISPETLEITDPAKAKEILISSGRSIISAGYPEKVKSLAKILDSETERSPLILLVIGYAEQTLGNYLEAFALLSKAEVRRDELSEDDKQFLDVLRKNCEYLTGRISIAEFSVYLNENKDNITGRFKQSYRLHQLSYSIWNTKDPYQMPEIISEFSDLVEEILADPTSSNVFRLYAKTLWIEVEGIETAMGLTRDIIGDEMRVMNGLNSSFQQIVERYQTRLNKWLLERANTVKEAERLNHRGLIASLKLTSALVTFQQISSTYSLALIRRVPMEKFFDSSDYKKEIINTTEISVKLIDEAIEIFREINNLEGELRGMMIKADFYEFIGKTEDAQKIAGEVLPKAKALQYIRQIEAAQDHLAGLGLKAKLKSSIKNLSYEERQEENANWSDEKVKFLASQMVRINGLPNDRYPAMEYEYYSIKRNSQEKLNWCREIELLQDLTHKQSPKTMFKANPDRVCVCNLYGYQSKIRNPDFEVVILAFKKTYCENCPSRSPLKQ